MWLNANYSQENNALIDSGLWIFKILQNCTIQSHMVGLHMLRWYIEGWIGRNKNKLRERKQTAKCSHRLLPISADPLNLSLTCPQLNIKAGDCIIFISSHSVTCLCGQTKMASQQ